MLCDDQRTDAQFSIAAHDKHVLLEAWCGGSLPAERQFKPRLFTIEPFGKALHVDNGE